MCHLVSVTICVRNSWLGNLKLPVRTLQFLLFIMPWHRRNIYFVNHCKKMNQASVWFVAFIKGIKNSSEEWKLMPPINVEHISFVFITASNNVPYRCQKTQNIEHFIQPIWYFCFTLDGAFKCFNKIRFLGPLFSKLNLFIKFTWHFF